MESSEISNSRLKQRKAPVILRSFAESRWGKPIYLSKGDEVEVFVGQKRYFVSCHGAGWLCNQLVTCAADIEKVLPTIKGDLINTVGSNSRGSLCIYLRSPQGYYILPDPLGACILFEYKSPRLWAHSSDLESLINAVKEHGEQVRKSLDYLVEVVATGNGGFFSASYEDVDAFSPFTYLFADDTTSRRETYSVADTFFSHPSNMDDLFEAARCDLISNVKAVANSSFEHRISHLTGGFDSRLILSALMYTGNHDKFRFMCSGSPKLPDRKIAGELCGHVGVCFTNSDGTIKAPYEPGNAMFGTHGLLRLDLPASSLPGHVLMSGGYGECLRSFYGARSSATGEAESVLQALYGRFFANDSGRIVSDSFNNVYVERFRDFLKSAVASGIPHDAVLDYMYAAKRNRYYVGLTSEYYSNLIPRVDPIYSVNAVRLGLFTPQPIRSANVLGLRMMASLCPELVQLPFDSERITPAYESLYGHVPKKAFNGRAPRYIHDDRIVAPSSKAATEEQVARAQEMKGSLLQIVHLHDVQSELKNLLKLNRREVTKAMDWIVVNRLLNPNLANRVHIRAAFALHDSLRWFNS